MKFDSNGRLFFLWVCSLQLYSAESFNWTIKPANPTLVIKGGDKSFIWNFTLSADEKTASQTFYAIKWKKFNPLSLVYDQIASKSFVSFIGTPTYNEPKAPDIEIDKYDPATLLINNVKREDEGTYKIEYSLKVDGTVHADDEVNVTVLERPEIANLSNDQDVCKGSMVTLGCNATGKPTPNITWTRVWDNGTDSGELPSVDGYYVIRNISRSSNGTYRCTASNGVGGPVNQTMEVIVGNSSSVVDVVFSSNTVMEGLPYNLSCEVFGDPLPSVSWIKASNDELHIGKLLNFTSIRRNDAGNYTCEATNRCGNDSETISINVFFKPEIKRFETSASSHLACQNDVISFNCSADANPPVISYQLFENDTAILNTNSSGMWSRNMSTRGVFIYECVANNTYGTGNSEKIAVRVYVPPSIQKIDNQTKTRGNNITLTCPASGDPPLKVFWIKPDGQRTTTNVLTLINITKSEAGEYRCEATNDCGSTLQTINVEVQYKPKSVILQKNVSINESCETMWVKFNCSSSDANPPIHNYLLYNGTSLVDTDFQGHWIKKISPGHWLYSCEANQSIGITKSANDISLTVFTPTTIADMSNHSVIEGGNLTLECNVSESSQIVSWTHINSNVIKNGKTWIITYITRQGHGEYMCEASNFCGHDRESTYVDVKFKPTNVTLRVNETKVCKNSSISFTCKAKANPEVHSYQLHVNDVNSTDENSDGTWTKTMFHEGEYRYSCVANNSVGLKESNTVIVTVIAPVTIADMNKHHSVIEGGNLTLECVVAGSSPNVTWTHINSSKITKGKTWNITNITIQEHGGYICEASNFCGPDRKGTYVDVKFKPTNVTLRVNETKVCKNSSISFTCKAKANPEVHSYQLHVNDVNSTDEDSDGTWTKTMFHEGEYRYSCVANNSVGLKESNTVIVTVIAPASILDMSSHSVIEYRNLILESVVAGSSPNVTWTHINSSVIKNGKTWTITNITRQGSGEYICEASNFCGHDRKSTYVDVKFPGETTRKSNNCPEYRKIGVPFIMDCPVEGNPRPNISWAVGGKSLRSDKSNITVTHQNTGEHRYTCTADNGIGDPDSSTFLFVVNRNLKKEFTFMIREKNSKLTAKLNDDNSKEFRDKDKEFKNKIKKVIPECHKHEVDKIELRPGSIIIYFRLSFENPMGQEALTSMLQEAVRKGQLGDVDSIEVTDNIPAKKNCSGFYEDDQICKTVKTVWIVSIVTGVLFPGAVIIIIVYSVHKRRKCTRKDKRIHSETDERQAFSSNPGTPSEGNPYAGVNSGYANAGPQPSVEIEQELGEVGGEATPTYALVDKSKKKDKKKAAEEKPTEDQYAVVDKSKKKKKKNEPDATYAEVDMSNKSKKKPKPGEVLYADLGEFHHMQRMPEVSTSPKTLPPIKLPEAYAETQYADITQFLKGNPHDTGAEPPNDSITSAVNNTAACNEKESSAGNTGDSAEATNETGF